MQLTYPIVAPVSSQSWFFVDLIGSIPVEYIISANTAGFSGVERKAFKASVKYLKVPVGPCHLQAQWLLLF